MLQGPVCSQQQLAAQGQGCPSMRVLPLRVVELSHVPTKTLFQDILLTRVERGLVRSTPITYAFLGQRRLDLSCWVLSCAAQPGIGFVAGASEGAQASEGLASKWRLLLEGSRSGLDPNLIEAGIDAWSMAPEVWLPERVTCLARKAAERTLQRSHDIGSANLGEAFFVGIRRSASVPDKFQVKRGSLVLSLCRHRGRDRRSHRNAPLTHRTKHLQHVVRTLPAAPRFCGALHPDSFTEQFFPGPTVTNHRCSPPGHHVWLESRVHLAPACEKGQPNLS